MDLKKIKWMPKEGLYQCVIPDGVVHIDLFVDGRSATPVKLTSGDEVELYERELRILKKSEILYMGYLAPITYYVKDENGESKEIDASEDETNPNVINDDLILVKVQGFKDAEEFGKHLKKITSILTVNRFLSACGILDTPRSFITAAEERLKELNIEERNQMYSGDIDPKRKEFLTPKIEK